MPAHLVPVLGTELVADLVAVCDTALYKAVVSIYIATPLQNIPDKYVRVCTFALGLYSSTC